MNFGIKTDLIVVLNHVIDICRHCYFSNNIIT